MGYIFYVKNTNYISDHLHKRVKSLARKEKTSLRELTEEGLELVVEKHSSRGPHRVKPVLFGGQGLSPEFQGKSWADIRDEIYRGLGS